MLGRNNASKICPLIKAACKREQCEWYVHLRGINPNTGDPVDEGKCAIAWGPFLAIENAKAANATGAAVESFRNEMVKSNELNTQLLIAASNDGRTLIGGST